MTIKTITVEKTFGDKTVSKAGTVQVVETAEDVLTLLQEDSTAPVAADASDAEKGRVRNRVLNLMNYALDLKQRAKLNAQLSSENVDPNKANEKALEQFNKARLANGKTAVDMEKFILIMGS